MRKLPSPPSQGEFGVHIALIRAIGPETHCVMPMAALREACAGAGLISVSSHLATGNLVFQSAEPQSVLRASLETIISGFGIFRNVALRRPEEFQDLLSANPFPEAAASRPDQLVVCFLDDGARLDWIGSHEGPERLARVGRDLCVDYGGQISRARLQPGLIEKRAGVVSTFRNWNTVLRLAEAAAEMGP